MLYLKISPGYKIKGIVFSLDVILGISALLIVLISSLFLLSSPQIYDEREYSQQKFIADDFLNSLAELKVYEAENQSSTIKKLIENTQLSEDELELYVLNLVVSYWAKGFDENNDTKKEIAKNITLELAQITRSLRSSDMGIYIGSESLLGNYSDNYYPTAISSLIESTFGSDEPKFGYMSRAYLTEINAEKSAYLYFGGFVGQGNISLKLVIPDVAKTINSAYIEASSGDNFSIKVNGIPSGNIIINTSSTNFSANVKSYFSVSGFNKGVNNVEIAFDSNNLSNQYFGGGFIRIKYNTTEFFEGTESGKKNYTFPGIIGIPNLFDGTYVPGNLTETYIKLHYKNNLTNGEIYLNIANATIFESNLSGENTVNLSNGEVLSALSNAGIDYTYLSSKSFPLRFGIKSVNFTEKAIGNADIILITDVSGSMSQCVENNNECSYPNRRIDLAKQLAKEFVSIILNSTGNRVGLAAYRDNVENSHPLSTDKASLFAEIDTYDETKGGTCICCGLNEAYEMLEPPKSNSSRQRYVIIMTDGIPSHKCTFSGCSGIGTTGRFEADCYGCTYCCPANPLTGTDCSSPTSGCGYYWEWDYCQRSCKCLCEIQNANFSSCRLKNDLDATVHSIGFGPVSSCDMGKFTLQSVSDCGGGEFYASQNASGLQKIYEEIAQSIVSISYSTQIVKVFGNVSKAGNILYNDSYLQFEFDKIPASYDYGEFSVIFEENCSETSCFINNNNDTKLIDSKVTSYSSDYWTKTLLLDPGSGNKTIYNLSIFGKYPSLGDPYMLYIPVEEFSSGENNIFIILGINNTQNILNSADSKIIYSIKVPGFVGYGGIFNTMQEAKDDAEERLKQKIYDLTGKNISISGISTETNVIQGVKTVSNTTLIKLLYWKE